MTFLQRFASIASARGVQGRAVELVVVDAARIRSRIDGIEFFIKEKTKRRAGRPGEALAVGEDEERETTNQCRPIALFFVVTICKAVNCLFM